MNAEDKLKKINDAVSDSFMTCTGGNNPRVTCEFKTLDEAQEFYTLMMERWASAKPRIPAV